MKSFTGTSLVFVLCFAGSLALSCKPKYPNCKNDDDCKDGELCVSNQCQQCREDGDCELGQTCVEGACREAGFCNASSDCAEGQVCRDAVCSPCLDNSECADGRVCSAGACIDPECRSDADCPADLSCIDYRCTSDESAAHETSAGDCRIEPVYFAYDSSRITEAQRATIEKNRECLKSHSAPLVLEGHADPRGTTEYNMALGDRRARSVKRYITTLGLDNNRLRAVSKGEEEATGYNERTWAEDRRVDFN